jgi:hypothetical protein
MIAGVSCGTCAVVVVGASADTGVTTGTEGAVAASISLFATLPPTLIAVLVTAAPTVRLALVAAAAVVAAALAAVPATLTAVLATAPTVLTVALMTLQPAMAKQNISVVKHSAILWLIVICFFMAYAF